MRSHTERVAAYDGTGRTDPAATAPLRPSPPAAPDPPKYEPDGVYVIDAQTGGVRRIDIVERMEGPGGRLVLVMGRTAVWTRSGSALRLEGLDGSVIGEWRSARYDEPTSSADGSVLLLPLDEGWAIQRRDGARQSVLKQGGFDRATPSGSYFVHWVFGARISPNGRYILYRTYEDAPRDAAVLRVYDIGTGADTVVDTVTPCSGCDGTIVIEWSSDSRAVYFRRTLTSPTRRFDVASGTAVEVPYEQQRADAYERFIGTVLESSEGASCVGLLLDHPRLDQSQRCVRGARVGAWAPDSDRIAYLHDHKIVVRDVTSSSPPVATSEFFRDWFYWSSPAMQWDASGRYVVFAAVGPQR